MCFSRSELKIVSTLCLSSAERQDKSESAGGLLPAGVMNRKKESSAVFVRWHGMFLGAGASRF